MKRRKKKLEKGTEARRRARKSGLAPGNTRVIEDKRKKTEKHKQDLLREPQDFLSFRSSPDRDPSFWSLTRA